MRKNKVLAILAVYILTLTSPVAAEVVNYQYSVDAYTSVPNDTALSSVYITADTQHRPGYELADIYISWEIKAGDTVEVWFWDGQAVELQAFSITPSNTSVRSYKVTPPAGACTAQIVLESGSATGNRYAWIKKFDNNYGDTAVFLDPTIEGDPGDPQDPPDDPPDDPPTGTDLTEVIAGINEVKGAINGMSSGVITELQGVRNQLISLTSDMNQQFDAVKSRLDVISNDVSAIRSDVADIKDDVSVIKSDVATMKEYFTTPRSPSPLQMNPLPTPSMDSSVPDLSEPYQTPYTYDRDEPTIPPAEFGPEPLPFAPDPEVMPHDEPLLAEAPIVLDEPILRENPRAKDPIIKEEPRQMDPANMESPRAVDTPITRKNPFGRNNPLTPQTPLTPTPSIMPGG